MHGRILALVLVLMTTAMDVGADVNGDRDPPQTSVRTVLYGAPERSVTADGGTRLTYVGRLDGDDRVRVVLEAPPGWNFSDETIPIRVQGTWSHEGTGTSVRIVTQIDEGHFCNTHVAAHVVRRGTLDGVPYCVLELEDHREWTIDNLLSQSDGRTRAEIEADPRIRLAPVGATMVHYSFQIPDVTGWLAGADVTSDAERRRVEEFVMSGLKVSFLEPRTGELVTASR